VRRLRTVSVAGLLLVSMIFLVETALSQTNAVNNAKGSVDLTPIIVALINLVFPAVAAVATYLINAHVRNRELATQLSNAVDNAMGTVQQHAADSLQTGANLRLTVEDPAIQKGVQYVINNAAEAIAHFKIPTDRIAQKLEAKVGLSAIQTNLAATASPMPVISGPLAPVPAIHSAA
jgi:hypothetical protein